jgi:hypothetical protein
MWRLRDQALPDRRFREPSIRLRDRKGGDSQHFEILIAVGPDIKYRTVPKGKA